jgi:hypothetical protein
VNKFGSFVFTTSIRVSRSLRVSFDPDDRGIIAFGLTMAVRRAENLRQPLAENHIELDMNKSSSSIVEMTINYSID